MHGDDELRVYGVRELTRGRCVYRVVAADGDEQRVHMADGLYLPGGQHVAYVAQMRDPGAAARDYADEVVAALFALDVVVPAEEGLHGVVRLLARERDLVLGAVVVVPVAAKYHVRGESRQLQAAGEIVRIGVKNEPARARLEHEAGVSVPR